jgi:hypothetical protein
MKKALTLLALVASVASVGVAHAQATVSGTIRYDLSNSASTLATGITKSEINVTAVEKLGSGVTVTAKLGLDGAERNGTTSGTDASVTVASGFGAVMVGQIELGNGIINNGYAGAPVIGADGSVLAAKGNADIVKLYSPTVGGFTASVSSTRAIDSTVPRKTSLGIVGRVAGIATAVDYNVASNRIRASASTKVAGLTVGAGVSANEVGVKDSYAVGVSQQMGAITVGAAYSQGAGRAREVGVSYALSVRSTVQVAYQDLSTGNNTAQVRLQHTF